MTWKANRMRALATLVIVCAATSALAHDPITGVYRLTTRAQPTMALAVWGSNTNANGTAVQLWYANRSNGQQWLVERQAEGTYKVYAYSGRNSLQMLDLTGGNTALGTLVNTWEDNGLAPQLWYFLDVGGGYYRMAPKNAGSASSKTVEIAGGPTAGAGARTQIGTYNGGDNQVFRLDWTGVLKTMPNPKKGLAGRPPKVPYINGSWYYTWGGDLPADAPTGVEFVPMEWGYYGNANNASLNWLNWVKSQPGVQRILAFNEPDNPAQANLTVDYALEGYGIMAGIGLPLGSPATVHADNQWMRDFMAGCSARGYRVDWVNIHWYGGADAAGFLGHVDTIHNLYGKPVWITEFAPADWSGNRGISPQQCADFMRTVLPELNRRSYVLRYSWFSAGTGDAALGAAALVNDDGTLTDLGHLYGRM